MISINAAIAEEHRSDLLRDATARRLHRAAAPPADKPARMVTIALRLAADDETRVVRRLAQLDDAPELQGPVLLALIDDEAVAAVSLRDRRVVANPFVPTQDEVALLRLQASQLFGKAKRRRPRPTLRPRFA
jgi:hypothetical protein